MSAVGEDSRSFFRTMSPSAEPTMPDPWPPALIPGEAIADEIDRLIDLDQPADTRRASEIVHPQAPAHMQSMTPGLSVSINVVRPGETVTIRRDNANGVEFCLSGSGAVAIGGSQFTVEKWSVWNRPTMQQRRYTANGGEPLVWLSYSNAPLLNLLGVHYSDDAQGLVRGGGSNTAIEDKYQRVGAPDIQILDAGARLRGYEFLVDIDVLDNRALHWPWAEVSPYLSQVLGDQKRTIMLMYNPLTERRAGTSNSFFATIQTIPGGADHPPPTSGHWHTSFACNYHFRGSGRSIVGGKLYEWKAGDLMLSAPSWVEHAHGSSIEGSAILTIQDHPFHISNGSLVWRESRDGPILTLGAEEGQRGYVGPRLAGS